MDVIIDIDGINLRKTRFLDLIGKGAEPVVAFRGVKPVENLRIYHQFSMHCPPVTGIA